MKNWPCKNANEEMKNYLAKMIGEQKLNFQFNRGKNNLSTEYINQSIIPESTIFEHLFEKSSGQVTQLNKVANISSWNVEEKPPK